jgi:hypothetical protein
MKTYALCFTLALSACATPADQRWLYFPELAARAAAYEPAALREILVLSQTTSPGEQLEELAELAASYIEPRATVFLQAQAGQGHCFGSSFLGPRFVDNAPAREAELSGRRKALAAVGDPKLTAIRDICLASLSGS